jgi:hypothetical protein
MPVRRDFYRGLTELGGEKAVALFNLVEVVIYGTSRHATMDKMRKSSQRCRPCDEHSAPSMCLPHRCRSSRNI